eukprot:6191255-Alexandrium_andersonii.AAC.1
MEARPSHALPFEPDDDATVAPPPPPLAPQRRHDPATKCVVCLYSRLNATVGKIVPNAKTAL